MSLRFFPNDPDFYRKKQGSAKMIEFKDFSFRYKSSDEAAPFALENINMTIQDGEFVGITGNSGAGKSTLTYAVAGLVPHHFEGDFYGSVTVNGLDTVEVKPEALAKYVGEVFQDIDSQMVASVVEDELLFGLENFGVPHDEITKRLDNVLNTLGIASLRRRQISSLSGGQKQKVAIASILALSPDIIVLDEPTGELDPESTVMIYDILKTLNRDFHKTVIVVEQKIMVLCAYVPRLVVLSNGRTVYDGKSSDITNQVPLFKKLGINVPRVVELGQALKKAGLYNGQIPTEVDGAEKMVLNILGNEGGKTSA